MSLSASMLPEFDHEMAGLRRVLERVPDGKTDWRPHEKSMPLNRLASHLAELPGWCTGTFKETSLDLAPPGAGGWKPLILGKTAEIMGLFDDSLKAGRAALVGASDADMMVGWSLMRARRVLFTLPRIAVYRSFCMNHMIHHRAQLGVYLRLLGVAVPSLYGPTADETM
jgi:DinB family protein